LQFLWCTGSLNPATSEEKEMSNIRLNLITAAAALIAASATASAQNALIANVPFEFKISSRTVLPAGGYNVIRTHPDLWVFEDRESGHKTMVAIGVVSSSGRYDRPQLEFRCHGNECALTKIQVGYGETGYEVPQPKPKSGGDEVAVRIVPLSHGSTE
jgi:hypothetical protein